MPDTQRYSQAQMLNKLSGKNTYKDRYIEQTKYIRDTVVPNHNVKMVIHLGDITNFNLPKEWDAASAAHKIFDDAKIPYLILPGNHDFKSVISETNRETVFNGTYLRSRTRFGDYFYKNSSKSRPSYKGFGGYESTTNSYATFSVGKIKFLVIALEYAARKEVVCWAENLIKSHLDHYVIIATHNYLDNDTQDGKKTYATGAYLPIVSNGVSGEELANELTKRFSNVILVVSGHIGGVAHHDTTGYNGNHFQELVVDYSGEREYKGRTYDDGKDLCGGTINAGNGWMRILKFNPKKLENNVHSFAASSMPSSEFPAPTKPLNITKRFLCPKRYGEDPKGEMHNFYFTADISAPANGQYKVSDISFGEREINAETNGVQAAPSIGMNRKTGEFVAVWKDNSSDADGTYGDNKVNYDIAARLFCAGGCVLSDQFIVNTETAGNQYNPDAAMDNSGNFVIVWASDEKNNSKAQIYMRGYDFIQNDRIKTTKLSESGDCNNPKIAMTSTGNYVVAWEQKDSTSQIMVRGYHSDGTQIFAAQNVLDTASGNMTDPGIAMSSDGSFVVVWQDNTNHQISARAFQADGKPKSAVFKVNTLNGQPQKPSIDMNQTDGSYFIAYEDNANSNSTYGIRVRGFDKNNEEILSDSAVKVHDYNDGHQYPDIPPKDKPQQYPSICADDKGGAVVTWFGKAPGVLDHERIFSPNVQRATITKYNNEYRLSNPKSVNTVIYKVTDDNNKTKQPAIACTADSHSVILWTERLDQNKVTEIYGRGY